MRLSVGFVALAMVFGALAPAIAQDLRVPDLQRIAEAADRGDVVAMRAVSRDLALLQRIREADPDTFVEVLIALAEAYASAGQAEEAKATYRLAIQITREERGDDDLSLAEPLLSLARLEDDPSARLDSLQESYRIREAVLGYYNPVLQPYRAELEASQAAANRDLASRGIELLPAPPPPPPIPGPVAAEDRNFQLVDIYWATHRTPTGRMAPDEFYGGLKSELTFGTAEVSVPRDRAVGSLPLPMSILTLEFRPDPDRHMILNRVTPLSDREQFMATVARKIGGSSRKELFVFVHGYNTSFEGAALRTAQLAVDMSLDGAPILYSWPSRASLLSYAADTRTVADDALLDEVAAFFTDLSKRSGAERIHLVAHSMGTRVLLRALDRIAAENVGRSPLFNEVVFAAADIGVDEFDTTWPRVTTTAQRFTLYASQRDRALQVSNQVNQMRRVGDAREVTVKPGLQTIDTTAASSGLLGHDDFAGSALADFRGVVWLSLAPERRCVLQNSGPENARFWIFGSGCPENDFISAAELVRTSGSYPLALSALEAELPQAPPERRTLLEKVRTRLTSMFPGSP